VATWFDPELTTLAFCWRLARRDGIVLGFTSHDLDLVIGGLTYRAAPGMVPSAIERGASLDADTVDLSGVLSSDAITAADLIAGRWDGALLRLFAVDWTAPDVDSVPLVRGTLGAVQMAGDQFEVELQGPTAALDAPVIETISPDCRAELGDARCRVDLAGRSILVKVTSANEAQIIVSTAIVANDFAYGRLRWLDGANAGLSATILANSANSLSLAEPPPLPVAVGDRAEITQGCDRRFATCIARFANAPNFRGEPHLPGNDLLTRYVS
jgi:uncharacterized phage protein (TIGR02218 family)